MTATLHTVEHMGTLPSFKCPDRECALILEWAQAEGWLNLPSRRPLPSRVPATEPVAA
jgi:hypothetical protein